MEIIKFIKVKIKYFNLDYLRYGKFFSLSYILLHINRNNKK